MKLARTIDRGFLEGRFGAGIARSCDVPVCGREDHAGGVCRGLAPAQKRERATHSCARHCASVIWPGVILDATASRSRK